MRSRSDAGEAVERGLVGAGVHRAPDRRAVAVASHAGARSSRRAGHAARERVAALGRDDDAEPGAGRRPTRGGEAAEAVGAQDARASTSAPQPRDWSRSRSAGARHAPAEHAAGDVRQRAGAADVGAGRRADPAAAA